MSSVAAAVGLGGDIGGFLGDPIGTIGEGLGVIAPEGVGQASYDQALAIQNDIYERAKKLDIPDIEAQKLALELPEMVGTLEPEEIRDRIARISPRARDLQLESIEGIRELSQQGLSEEDRAAFEQLRRETAQEREAAQQSVLQEMAQRGALDSGAQLAAQLQADQQASEAQAEQARQVAGQSAAARRQALQNMAGQTSRLREQERQEAQAQSAIDRFNAQQRMGAQKYNVGEQQRIAEAQTNIKNKQQQYNKQLQQQEFQNRLKKLDTMGGAGSQLAGGYQQKGAMQAQGAQQRAAGTMGTIMAPFEAIGSLSPGGGKNADGGVKYQDGGIEQDRMAYQDGGQGTTIPGKNYAGDELQDRINSGEMVINVEQQDRLNDMLQELQARREGKRDNGNYRVDEALEQGKLNINDRQQDSLMDVLRGDKSVQDLPEKEDVVETVEEKGLKKLLQMLGRS